MDRPRPDDPLRDLLFAALEHSPVPKVVTDEQMVVRYLNRASTEKLGALQGHLSFPVGEIVGMPLDALVDLPWRHPAEASSHDGATRSTLITLGEETLELWVDALVTPDGTFVGAVATWDVVTGHITTLQRENSRLQHHADHDSLTGALTRRAFTDAFDARSDPEGALFLFDLDNFKHHNDTFGHARGDQILVAVVDGIRRRLRRDDVVARMGGDEFIVLMNGVRAADADGVAADLLRRVSESARRASYDPDHPVTVSIGVVALGAAVALDSALTRADAALYEAKQSGRNTFRRARPSAAST